MFGASLLFARIPFAFVLLTVTSNYLLSPFP